MKTKTTIFLLAIVMTSCMSPVTPTTSPENTSTLVFTQVPSKTRIPTNFFTPTFTPVPPTETPVSTQTRMAFVTPEPEPILSMLSPIKTKVFVIGITNEGERNYSLGDGTPFRILYEPQGGFMSLQFEVVLSGRLKELTLPQITSLTSAWQISIYCYRTDETVSTSNQPAIVLNNLQAEMNIDAPYLKTDIERKKLLSRLGDCRAFTFQLSDGKGNVQQGNFVINPNAGLYGNDDVRNAINEGVLLGYPYSLYQNEAAFFRQGEFITVQEPQGGFYRLYYMFNFVLATGVSATIEQEELASELTINFFPYRSDRDYTHSETYPVVGEIHSTSGVYTVDLPIEILKSNVSGDNKYHLQIVDSKGNTIKEEYFIFIPYNH